MPFLPRALSGAILLAVFFCLAAPAGAQTADYAQIGPWKIMSWSLGDQFNMCSATRQDPELPDGAGGFLRLDRYPDRWEITTDFTFGIPKQKAPLLIDGTPYPVVYEQIESVSVGRLRPEAIAALRTARSLNLNFDPTGPMVPLKGIGRVLDTVERCVRTEGAPDMGAGKPTPAASTGIAWLASSGGKILPGAVPAGREANGEKLFVCAAPFANGTHPGKVRPGFDGCHIGYGGQEQSVPFYTLMIGKGRWVPGQNGQIPPRAVQAGQEANGRPLYVCRAQFKGGVHPGKIGPSTGSCNIGYGGTELTITNYAVLTD